jgi:hypothetical protein
MIVASSMFLDSALINPEPVSQFVDGNTICITSDQLFHPGGFETPADPPARPSLVDTDLAFWYRLAIQPGTGPCDIRSTR